MTSTLLFTFYDLSDNTYTLQHPIEFEIVKSYDSPAQSFEGIFPCDADYPEFYRMQVSLNGNILFKGRLDEQTETHNDQGRRLTIMARSLGALLLDNEALPQTYTNVYLSDLFDEHIRPYGFTSLTAPQDVFFNQYQVVKGMSGWEVFYNFFRSSALGLAYVDDDDNIICQFGPPMGETYTFSNLSDTAMHYSSLKVTRNRYSDISKYVIRNSEGVYDSSYISPNTVSWKLNRTRYLIPSPEFSLFENAPRQEAILRIRRAHMGRFVVTLTYPGIFTAKVGDRINLNTGLHEYTGLFAHQVRMRMSAAGMTTTYTLLDPTYV